MADYKEKGENKILLFPCVSIGHKANSEYCADRKISFPKIDYKKLESEPIREVYVFEDKENPDVPIVIHFPLVNVSFKQFKSPGEYRQL